MPDDTELPSYNEATMDTSDTEVTVRLVDGATQTFEENPRSSEVDLTTSEVNDPPAPEETEASTPASPPSPPSRFRFLRFGNKNNK